MFAKELDHVSYKTHKPLAMLLSVGLFYLFIFHCFVVIVTWCGRFLCVCVCSTIRHAYGINLLLVFSLFLRKFQAILSHSLSPSRFDPLFAIKFHTWNTQTEVRRLANGSKVMFISYACFANYTFFVFVISRMSKSQLLVVGISSQFINFWLQTTKQFGLRFN